ncbi:hypothetical protein XENTR_v10000670 [Xenopus tropicalis]|nr:hypothetical protein XENTR_v10000670 [Xenopus tropicalis]
MRLKKALSSKLNTVNNRVPENRISENLLLKKIIVIQLDETDKTIN